MKLNVISRDDEDYTRSTKNESYKIFYNKDPKLHPFERPREFVRAFNATKIKKITAKPFIAGLEGHSDTPMSLAIHPQSVVHIISGAANGEIKIWDLGMKKEAWKIENAHEGFVNGICIDQHSTTLSKGYFFTCSVDKTLKRWKLNVNLEGGGKNSHVPVSTYTMDYSLYCLDHHFDEPVIVTGGENLDVWDTERTIPKQSFQASDDYVQCCKFNHVEKSLVTCSTRDRTIFLYDIKAGVNIRQFTMKRKTNCLCWNPMKPHFFSAANDDLNVYTYDMRKLEDGPVIMHAGHLNAVMSIDYSPTGLELCSGSYDKTIRIFRTDTSDFSSREVYHAQRMQRVFTVKYTGDAKYIISGSDDYCLRIWKNHASEPLRYMSHLEKQKFDYNEKLIERFKDIPQIRRIAKHHHLPRKLHSFKEQFQKEREGEENRENRRKKFTLGKKYQNKGVEKPTQHVASLRNFIQDSVK